ncbi:DNA-binding protein, partial [Salmonella enterica]|nr:DNA-binding protein [Salmonella enterica]EDR9154878.1 DNA-binding protein [Salmonella enterica]EDX0179100.1 DNA-binding protein [Salmonella enterica]EDY2011717.1 DNA-binding protein [Salmonella enterica]
ERETKHIAPNPHSISDENWRRVLPRLRQVNYLN